MKRIVFILFIITLTVSYGITLFLNSQLTDKSIGELREPPKSYKTN